SAGLGPAWRSARAGADARCFIVPINDEEFFTTDGSTGLTRWYWPARERSWATVPKGLVVPGAELPARIGAAPLVLSADRGGDELRVCVADFRGVVTLLRGIKLDKVREWDLGGKVTAGPFRRGNLVGCVLDGRRLVWLDPGKDQPLWEYVSA